MGSIFQSTLNWDNSVFEFICKHVAASTSGNCKPLHYWVIWWGCALQGFAVKSYEKGIFCYITHQVLFAEGGNVGEGGIIRLRQKAIIDVGTGEQSKGYTM